MLLLNLRVRHRTLDIGRFFNHRLGDWVPARGRRGGIMLASSARLWRIARLRHVGYLVWRGILFSHLICRSSWDLPVRRLVIDSLNPCFWDGRGWV